MKQAALHYPKLQRKSSKKYFFQVQKGTSTVGNSDSDTGQLLDSQNHSISKCIQAKYVKYTKSSHSKIFKSCSFMNTGFNQPKKQIMHFKEISASRSFYSSHVLILTWYFQTNAPSTSGDARALPGILPSEGLPLLWQQHVLQDPRQRQPVTHS